MDHLFIHCFDTKSSSMLVGMQVGLCCTKNTGEIFALKKLRKSDMLRQGQVEHVRFERNLLVEVDSLYSGTFLFFPRFRFFIPYDGIFSWWGHHDLADERGYSF
ncbi:unnamed protein product [Coffea canephora]|uniref:DH200=94 genomic scaffold, scaffold_285 n=1 Tax=Coffea canephora TaxID=49390 RepID=A0A068VGH0_COFCA|nr:unnamed protein product [Coffea canephora]